MTIPTFLTSIAVAFANGYLACLLVQATRRRRARSYAAPWRPPCPPLRYSSTAVLTAAQLRAAQAERGLT